jgi:Peptidase A4 family/IPT/TIG domain
MLAAVGLSAVPTVVSTGRASAATAAGIGAAHDGVTVVPHLRGLATASSVAPAAPGATGTPLPGRGPDLAQPVGGRHPGAEVVSNSTVTTNWAGTVAVGSTFTGIGSEWTVPSVRSSPTPAFSATWIGIDGWGNTDLIQVGTAQDTSGTQYFAWYEVLPATAVEIPEPVSPSDEMDAAVVENTVGIWTIEIADLSTTTSWTFEVTVPYTGPGRSAEWIEEAPTVTGSQSTLADFGTARFTNAALGAASPTAVELTPVYMSNPGQARIIAYPGAGTTGGFSVFYGTPKPVITSVSPGQGSTSGGTSVTIDGTYLALPYPLTSVAVYFGTTPASSFSFNGDTITATAPPGAAGTVDIRVVTADGTSPTSSADRFTYVAPTPPPAPTSSPPAATSSGYDMVGSDGGVFVFPVGTAGGYYGSLPGDHVSVDDVVGMVPTPSDTGYFLVGADGGVFSFGDAPYLGSLPGSGIAVDDIRGIVPTSDNGGYFLVGADGGVFSFGDAPYLGSLPGSGIAVDDVVGIAATPDDRGYWLVTSTGHVYSYGDAVNAGSATGTPSPVSGIDSTPDGGGYWVVTQNGSVYAFGDAGYFGSLPQSGVTPARPVIGLVPTSDDKGYWLIGSDGGIFAYGDASFEGSLPQVGVDVTDIVGAVPTKG